MYAINQLVKEYFDATIEFNLNDKVTSKVKRVDNKLYIVNNGKLISKKLKLNR